MKRLTTVNLEICQKPLNDTLISLLDSYIESLHFEIKSTFENLRTTKYLEFIRNERSLKARSYTVILVKQFEKLTKFIDIFPYYFASYLQNTFENFIKIYRRSRHFCN